MSRLPKIKLTQSSFKKAALMTVGFFRIAPQDILIGLFAVITTLSLVSIFTYVYFASDLKNPDAIMNRNNTGVVLLDRNNKPFFRFYDAQVRTFIPISQIPPLIRESVITAEDKEFYSHPGFSPKAIFGAVLADLRHQKAAYGGSTITQQLVKTALLNSNKSFLRKFQELVLAQEIERKYSKDEILAMYLNSVYFGEGAFGIESASETFFNKHTNELTPAEAAMIAGLLNAPSDLSPISGDISKAKARQEFILNEMVGQKYLTEQQKDEAVAQKLEFNHSNNNLAYQAPHFALMVKDALEKQYGQETIARSGFVVKTSLDLDWQQYAEKTVAEQVEKLKANRVENGAAVVIDPTSGEVRALVGSKDWDDPQYGKFNITTANRQPGSSFKPIVYAAALERRIITPATILHDDSITYKPTPGLNGSTYSPKDYDGKYRGPVTARRALVNSLNIPAIEVESKVGVPATLEMARRLGIGSLGTDPSPYGLSIALGAGEVKLLDLTNAYATFANNGKRNDIALFTQIKDKQQQTIYQYQSHPIQVIDPGVAFQISSIISDNATRAEVFGNVLNISRPAAVKTGTTENYRDSLTMGYTPQVTVGVWVGNNDNTQMDQVAGAIGAAPIWKALVEHFTQGLPVAQFQPPDDIASISVCRGGTSKDNSGGTFNEYFLKGTEPRTKCSVDNVASDKKTDNVNDQAIAVSVADNGQYQTGGWYPVGEGGKVLQYWDGHWFDKPQQDKHKDK